MKRHRAFIKTHSICSIGFLMAFASLRAVGPHAGAELRVPRETKVLLLQPIDATEDSARLQPLRQQIVRLRQQYEFISRQFVVLGEALAAKASAEKPRLLLGAKEARSAEVLDELAKRTCADWVLSFTVKEISSDPSDSPDDATISVHSTLLIQIWDTRRHAWLENRSYTGRVSGGGSPPEMFIESLDAAVGEGLATVLSNYPKVVTVSQSGLIVDYLEGQTAPFQGDPAVPFSGLKAAPADVP